MRLKVSPFEVIVMKQLSLAVSVLLLCSTLSYGQAPSSPTPAAPNAIGHGAFPVKVTKTLDSSKLKAGDTVEFATAGAFKLPNGTLVPIESKLIGHVVAASARSKGDPDSKLTIGFDRLNIINGGSLSVKGLVQAVFPPADEPMPEVPRASTSPGANGMSGGAGKLTPDYKPMSEIKTGTDSGSRGSASVTPQAIGVYGIDNLQLADGALASKGKNVKLGGGVRMVVRVDIIQ